MKVQNKKKTVLIFYTKSCLYTKEKIYYLCFLFIKIVQNHEEPLDLY